MAGQCSKEYCSVQRRLEMKFSHCSKQTLRHGAKAATSGLVFHHIQLPDLSQKVIFCETSPLNLNLYSKLSTIKKRSLQSIKSSRLEQPCSLLFDLFPFFSNARLTVTILF